MNNPNPNETIKLPKPVLKSDVSVEEALKNRRSVREYKNKPLSLKDISQILWACQGITGDGKRTAPSAGALYALEIYIAAGEANELDKGVYHYLPESHSLEKIKDRDIRKELGTAAYGQEWVSQAPASLVITGIYKRITQKYRARGKQYTHLEAGHAAQNVYLQAYSLNIGTVFVGAFTDSRVQQILGVPKDHVPFAIMPLGYK
ncbi:SagB/ThcOx family dehydrogenase [Candidatus Woesearchaeota archaeon]|nr:SagB/ThcOx family dehydrogenase [Candidatus Woesearchaeota archaeon]